MSETNSKSVSILIPTYNRSFLLKETLKSILKQSFKDFEIIVCDNASTDNTEEIVKSFNDDRIKYFKNDINLGYGKNLKTCLEKAESENIFLMGDDDILLKDALIKTVNALNSSDFIGLVTRPYYWFCDDIKIPVRAIKPYNDKYNYEISIFGGKKQIYYLFSSFGQLSGLAFKSRCLDIDFHEETFTAHIYPFASILKKYKAVFLKDYTVAVRISSSMTRSKPEIYRNSPTESWVRMFRAIYYEKEFEKICKQCIDFISRNYEGLIQLKNYAAMKILFKEIFILIKYRWKNIFNFKFWLFSLLTILIPRKILIYVVDYYKRRILSKNLRYIVVNE